MDAYLYVHDLRVESVNCCSNDAWFAQVRAEIRNERGNRVRGAIVTGIWTDSENTISSDDTNGRGRAYLNSGPITGTVTTFTVTEVQHPDFWYNAAENRETTIKVEFENGDD